MFINPINVYRPYDWQRAFLLDRSLFCLLSGSAGGGKSKCAAEKIHAYMKKYKGRERRRRSIMIANIWATEGEAGALFSLAKTQGRIPWIPSK